MTPKDVTRCPRCGCDDPRMIEVHKGEAFCNVCAKTWRYGKA